MSNKSSDKLGKVNSQIKETKETAKDLAKVANKEIPEGLSSILQITSKIAETVKELSIYTDKIVQIQIEKGKELAQGIDQNAEKTISSTQVTAIKAESIMNEYLAKIGVKSEEQSEKYQQQVETNKKLLETTVDDINKKYDGSDIGLFNYKAHKENVEKHIEELNKYRQSLQLAAVNTTFIYDSMSKEYDKDSEQYKKIQADKKKALEDLQKQMLSADKTLKETNASYLSSWENRWKAVETKMKTVEKNMKNFTHEQLEPGVNAAFGTITNIYEQQIKTYDKKISYLEKDYKKKQATLDEELKTLTANVTTERKALAELETEKQEAEARQKSYEAQMKRLQEEFGVKDKSKDSEEDIVSIPEGESEGDTPKHTEDEIAQAQERFDQLNALNDAEKENAKKKADEIRQANISIFESEQEVLDEKKRIENEKKNLEKQLTAEKEKLEKDKQKKQERLDKIKRIKDKADHLVSMAKATTNIAEGITKALGYGPFIGPVLAAGLAVSGAVQLGIMAGQLKYMEDGGLLNGKRHRDGGMRIEGTNIEVEGGEYVVNRESTRKNIGLISYINKQRRALDSEDIHSYFSSPMPSQRASFLNVLEEGGQVPMMPVSNNIESEILHAVREINFQPRVAVTDIHHAQQQMTQVDEWVGM